METNPNEVEVQPAPTSTPPPVANLENKPKKSHKLFFFLLGIFIILILIGGVGGGYYFGRSSITKELNPSSPVIPPKDPDMYKGSPTPEILIKNNENLKSYTSLQLPGNALNRYSINYPEDWILKNERTTDGSDSDTTTISRGNYSLSIYQAAYGGGGCIFEGEMPEGPYDDYRNTKYTEIDSGIGKLRRIISNNSQKDNDQIRFGFCISTNGKDFGSPTLIGDITYLVPSNYDENILKEMDNIVKTLKSAE